MQDNAQNKNKFGENEYNSTAHWGRYGHQILNGLIYQIEKYGYDRYAYALDETIPRLNKIRQMHKDNFKGIDEFGNPIYTNYKKIEKEINKLGDIIDNLEERTFVPALSDIKNALWEILYMDKTIIESPALLQDTFLVRFGHFSEADCKKGTVKLDGYTSTTYESGSAKHFEDKMAENPNRWAILIMAEKGTSGTRLNRQFDALTSEREWLLPRDQEYEVVDYNVKERTVLLRVKHNKLYN